MKKLVVLLAVVAFVATSMVAFANNGPAEVKYERKKAMLLKPKTLSTSSVKVATRR